jgi:AcrR family transcriptional regulator
MNLSFSPCRGGLAQRGEETRRRILDAAIEVFASVGYEAAHTRLLAERAGVKLPTLAYYFGSKEGLFRAVIEHITAQFERNMAPVEAHVRAALDEGIASPQALLDLLCELLDTFVATMLSTDQTESWRMIISRAENENLAAIEPLHSSIRRLTAEPCKTLIARLVDKSEAEEMTWMRAIAMLGQIHIFTKAPVCRGLDWASFTDERVKAVQQLVRENAVAIFGGPTRRNP